jgi:hypothetical protein
MLLERELARLKDEAWERELARVRGQIEARPGASAKSRAKRRKLANAVNRLKKKHQTSNADAAHRYLQARSRRYAASPERTRKQMIRALLRRLERYRQPSKN